jgi:perosamine synthetase
MRLPVAAPDLGGNEEKYVVDAVRSSWISSGGPYLERFESEFSELCDTRHAIAVSNGTVALHLALLALDLGPGDEVIVPSLTYIASVNAVRYVGATPVFVDVDPVTWCLDVEAVADAITSHTRAVVAVHLYGQPADMDGLQAVCAPRGVRIVEDAAEAPMAYYHGRPTGGLADIGTFSFYGNKLFTSGEGGAITLNDYSMASRLRLLRGQGMDPNRRYWFSVVGYNYRLTNIAAALLCAQLERRLDFMKKRGEIYARYSERLAGIPGITLQADVSGTTRSPWLYSILVEEESFGISRDDVMTRLACAGIETRPFFPPIHRLPPYEGSRFAGGDLAVTERLAAQGLNLPTFVGLGLDNVDLICNELLRCGSSPR